MGWIKQTQPKWKKNNRSGVKKQRKLFSSRRNKKKLHYIYIYIYTHTYIYIFTYDIYIYTHYICMLCIIYIYLDLYDPYSLQVGRAQSSVLQFRLDVVRQPYSQQTIGRGRGQQWSNRLNLGDMISWSSLTSLSQLFTPNYHDRSYLVIQPLLNQL